MGTSDQFPSLHGLNVKGGLPAPGFISLRILFYNLVDLANETEDDFDFLLSEAEVVFRCFMDHDLLDQSNMTAHGRVVWSSYS